jgi:hypothetical protein
MSMPAATCALTMSVTADCARLWSSAAPPRVVLLQQRDQVGRSRQASDVRRQNPHGHRLTFVGRDVSTFLFDRLLDGPDSGQRAPAPSGLAGAPRAYEIDGPRASVVRGLETETR